MRVPQLFVAAAFQEVRALPGRHVQRELVCFHTSGARAARSTCDLPAHATITVLPQNRGMQGEYEALAFNLANNTYLLTIYTHK
jgi:hypothetical protein